MVHQDEYDTLCRVLTDYEGYGTEDDDVVGDIDYVADFLDSISQTYGLNGFVLETIQRAVRKYREKDTDSMREMDDMKAEIYDLACRLQTSWDDVWTDTII